MRRTIVVIGAGLGFGLCTLSLGTWAALAASNASAGAAAASSAPTSGPEWCGFEAKAGSRVSCGYSTEDACKQAVGEHGAICIVDPYLTERRRARAEG